VTGAGRWPLAAVWTAAALALGAAEAQAGDPGFAGTFKDLSLDAGGGLGGAPEGMNFIVPPGAAASAEATTFSDGAKGARLTVKAVGDALMCTQLVPLGPQAFISTRLRVPQIAPGAGSWMGMNLELRARDERGNLVSPPGMMFTLVKNLREPIEWTDVESKVAVPAGATQGEFCFRFVLSTGVVEVDRIQIVSKQGDGSLSAAAPPAVPAAAPAPSSAPTSTARTTAPAPGPASVAAAAPTYASAPVAAPAASSPSAVVTVAPTLAVAASGTTGGDVARGFTLRVDQRASSVACSKWVPATGTVSVFGTVDLTAVNGDAVDWSGIAIEAYARDASERALAVGGVPYAPVFVAMQQGLGQKFSVNWSAPPGTTKARFCARFSDAAGNAVFDWKTP
jgi:hypothetical protein